MLLSTAADDDDDDEGGDVTVRCQDVARDWAEMTF